MASQAYVCNKYIVSVMFRKNRIIYIYIYNLVVCPHKPLPQNRVGPDTSPTVISLWSDTKEVCPVLGRVTINMLAPGSYVTSVPTISIKLCHIPRLHTPRHAEHLMGTKSSTALGCLFLRWPCGSGPLQSVMVMLGEAELYRLVLCLSLASQLLQRLCLQVDLGMRLHCDLPNVLRQLNTTFQGKVLVTKLYYPQ